MSVKFVSSRVILNEVRRLMPELEDKSDMLAFINDATDRVISGEQLQHNIALIPFDNYKLELPDGFKYIIQAAYRQTCGDMNKTRMEISQITQNILGSDCNVKIDIECPKCHSEECTCGTNIITVNTDRLFQTNNPHLYHQYSKHFYDYAGTNESSVYGYHSVYHPEFVLMKRTSQSFFNVPYHISECVNINLDSRIEYTVNDTGIIINKKSGEVLLAYYSLAMDESGYLLVPDDSTVIRAITYSVIEQLLYKKFLETFDQKIRLAHQAAEIRAERWIARAKARLMIPDFDNLYTFVKDFIHRVVPHYTFWENTFKSNGDAFKYPDETYNLKGFTRDTFGPNRY